MLKHQDSRPAVTEHPARAARAFIRKTYECYNVVEYMAQKYDIKGEIGIGEKDSEKA